MCVLCGAARGVDWRSRRFRFRVFPPSRSVGAGRSTLWVRRTRLGIEMARETAAASAAAAHISGTPAGRACKCIPACWCHPACTLTTRVAAEDHASTEHAWATLGDLLPTLPPSDEGIELLSRRLSRPLTIYKALLQLRLVPTSAPLHIHLLGADGREGRGAVATTEAFAPLRTLLRGQCPELRLLLCGPNCAEDDFSSMEVAWGQPALPPGTPPMSVEYSTGLYHEFAAVFGGARRSEAPQLAVAFNAGVWGYDTWRDTVRLLHAAGGARCAGWGAGGGAGCHSACAALGRSRMHLPRSQARRFSSPRTMRTRPRPTRRSSVPRAPLTPHLCPSPWPRPWPWP